MMYENNKELVAAVCPKDLDIIAKLKQEMVSVYTNTKLSLTNC